MFLITYIYIYIIWNDIEPIKLLWKSLIAMEPLAISFLLHSMYDLWTIVTNLKLWGYTQSDLCLSCTSDRGTLRHVLSAYPPSFQMYTWRHIKVLEMVIELLRAQCQTANRQPVTAKEPIIQFLKEGECPVRKQKIPKWIYWKGQVTGKSVYLKTSLQFPVYIIQTEKRPDIVARSDSKKSVLLIELTVPWEEDWGEAHQRRKNVYETLRADCVEKGWICYVFPFEVCHFVMTSTAESKRVFKNQKLHT